MVSVDSTIVEIDDLTYEPVPEQMPENELAALLTQLAQRQRLAIIE
jgi:CHASE2 domain-containing sensor protein